MKKQTKTAIYFFISVIVLTYTFYSFTTSIIAGLVIASFVSLFLFYDPKKIKQKNNIISTDSTNKET